MYLQSFYGLATAPHNTASEFPSHVWCSLSRHQDTFSQARGGVCSFRSQVRKWAPDGRLKGGAFKPIGVRVDALPSGVSGVAASVAAKNGGHEPKQKIPSKVRIAKRTYRRALKRAAVDGFAWYRGRYISVRREFVPRDPVVRPPPDFSNRLGLLSWNCSGLSAELKAELFHWLRQQSHIGAFLLQETHWSFSNEWRDSGWSLFHSADKKPKQGGVLTAIRASWVDEHTLSWKEVIPGHLTQVRCTFVKQQVDLINIYQHAWSSKTSEQTQELLTRRSRIWGALDGLLQSLPVRSEILLAGDFNTVLEPRTAVSGHGIFLVIQLLFFRPTEHGYLIYFSATA